jgi:hypothetical protein
MSLRATTGPGFPPLKIPTPRFGYLSAPQFQENADAAIFRQFEFSVS